MSTGAMAFDAWQWDVNGTNTSKMAQAGTIVAEKADSTVVFSSYTDANMSTTDINISTTTQGDALIYPAFNQKDGWGTEIIVRNNSKEAIVAKAVVYAADDSREVKDFNIYLSPMDVCRFTIADGKIKSTDGSIRTFGIYPHQATDDTATEVQSNTVDKTDYSSIAFADTVPFDQELTVESGYVAIFGMEQVTGYTKRNPYATVPAWSPATRATKPTNGWFHNDHAGLYAAYAASLDTERTRNWRNLTSSTAGNMYKGMFKSGVTVAPNVEKNASDNISYKWADADADIVENNTTFDIVDEVLSGTVRVYNAAGRDMILNAVALNGFTETNRLLWTEGEYASIADRCINDNNNSATDGTRAYYDVGCIKRDAIEFNATNAVYDFSNAAGDVLENKLLVTQPYKRILSQLDYNGTKDLKVMEWAGYTGAKNWVDTASDGLETVDTGLGWSFLVNYAVYDEDEAKNAEAVGGTIITSPRTSDDNAVKFNNELQEVGSDSLEKNPSLNGAYDALNGFAVFDLGIPAVTTQMIGSVVGSSAETNWIYTETMN
jgi:hypothetical protein